MDPPSDVDGGFFIGRGKPGGRAYELEVEKKAQVSATARKAVSFVAILGALGLLALFIKGYFTGRA
ncbi:hypothetical protein [Desulfofundulus thermocisternus]|uniref:hypothetical protein n=1 Tax=Desulfofundulus thermocisternus TaxID=42471 RepID=UPI0019F4B022|nr:hypothetical protein [Desulfofundulus thermocisternus]MBE3586447.1 hypothetical protein [Thermoanaerobacter sp.]MCS5696758.1 hypothetical protein [Desulfofundulus thermocisternus]